MIFDTEGLKKYLEAKNAAGFFDDHLLGVVQAYHTARLADAMDRLATHIENGQISILEGQDIANGIERVVRNTNQ